MIGASALIGISDHIPVLFINKGKCTVIFTEMEITLLNRTP